ncbi:MULTISPECIES: hypothetical protein [unclassified Prochlorococcus]|uniref:hypothetical protein n=1 Tax=unclassified Prochlorococcus TaxID=2627481 RepID=UPI000533BBF1|nr:MULTISPECIES: hypothetical protein [unclassified Prochlorococcus]KGG16311.1 hypothetical protein EV07_1480 [Prochlorococcus sp. MIT 0603]KGG17955.1 hypothetical protein EV06_0078 [Prochlorococcus sp. MIT 0602]
MEYRSHNKKNLLIKYFLFLGKSLSNSRSYLLFIFPLLFILLAENQSRAENQEENKIIWEKITYPESDQSSDEMRWEFINSDEIELGPDSINKHNKIPLSIDEAQNLYKTIKPIDKDFSKPTRISPSFPVTTTLSEGEYSYKVYSLSTFTNGAAGGAGNQNYAFVFDYGINENIQFSGFYSVADDPLFELINGTKLTPNYWEIYGISYKQKLWNKEKWDFSILASIESWNQSSGGSNQNNIFNNINSKVSSKDIIGSLYLPLTRKLTNNLDLNLLAGAVFLPDKHGGGNQNNFYGNNFYLGSGFSWKIRQNVYSSASIAQPFGPGNNTFDSNLNFSNQPTYTIGVNWDINPIIGLEGRYTNAFGATPATGFLLTPSSNRPIYFAGLKYRPGKIDSPQRNLSRREESLAIGGLTVNTAFIPQQGRSHLSANIDSKGNSFGFLGYSLSNAFQLEILNFGSFNDVHQDSSKSANIINTFMSSNNFNTRVGGKFVLASPLRNKPFWLTGRISLGRNQQSKQGYSYYELINTWEVSDNLAININPKTAQSSLSTITSLGLSMNLQISEKIQLIPETNIILSGATESNATLAIRRLMSDRLYFDIYMSSAIGLQDFGQVLGDHELKAGMKVNYIY